MQNLIDLAFWWGKERGIHDIGTLHTQLTKLVEEMGELAHAVARDDDDKIVDAVGDILVALVQFGAIHNKMYPGNVGSAYLHWCLKSALVQIENRTGKTVGGIFVRDDE